MRLATPLVLGLALVTTCWQSSASGQTYAASPWRTVTISQPHSAYYTTPPVTAYTGRQVSLAPADYRPTLAAPSVRPVATIAPGGCYGPTVPVAATSTYVPHVPVAATTTSAWPAHYASPSLASPPFSVAPVGPAPFATPARYPASPYYVSEGVFGQPKVFVEGQPVRNALRSILP